MKTAYSYTVLRYVHDTATGEFINVGVALLAPEQSCVLGKFRKTFGRLKNTFPDMDGNVFKGLMVFIQERFNELHEQFDRLREELPFEKIPDSIMDLAHRVLPPDDSSLQWAPAGGGLTRNPAETLRNLYSRFVTAYDEKHTNEHHRSDDEIWRKYERGLEAHNLLKYLKPECVAVEDDEIEFKHVWKNGRLNCLEPVSFDFTVKENIRNKAHCWLGQLASIQKQKDKLKVYMLLGKPTLSELEPEFHRAVKILKKSPVDIKTVTEAELPQFCQDFAQEIKDYEGSVA